MYIRMPICVFSMKEKDLWATQAVQGDDTDPCHYNVKKEYAFFLLIKSGSRAIMKEDMGKKHKELEGLQL